MELLNLHAPPRASRDAHKRARRLRDLVFTHLFEVKGRLLLAALGTLALAAADLLRPWPLKIIFDQILLSKHLPHRLFFLEPLFARGTTVALLGISLAIVAIAVVKSFSAYIQLHITSQISHRLAHHLRRELFVHLQKLSLSFHQRVHSGELLTKVTVDTINLRDLFSEFVLTFISEVLTLAGMLAIMVSLNWKLSLIAAATFPPLVALSLYRYRTIRDSAKRQRKAEGQVASRVSEMLSSISVVKAFGREEYEEERFEDRSAATLEESIRTARLEAAAARAVDIIVAIGTWAVVLVGSLQALRGQITPGSVLVFASYMTAVYGPIRNLAKLSNKFSRGMVSAARISEILDVEPDIEDDPQAIDPGRLRGEIAFQEVGFAYEEGKPVLSDLSLRIAPGEHVALLGRSGCGKSTLCSLILRFYDPQSGSITIDGIALKKCRREALRREIGIVLQDSILLGTTVRENIAYGKLDASMEEIVAAARAANAHDFIAGLENGYESIISEHGVNLSGGQRQRIALARTFIRGLSILILDEPTVGLDVESEDAVRDALRRLMAGKTCLLVTHDLEAAAESDRILLLDEGRIVEQGSHRELLARSPRYRELWEFKNTEFESPSAPVGMADKDALDRLWTMGDQR